MTTNILLGPLLIALDGAPENQIQGWALTLLLAAAILSFPLRPRIWSSVLAAVGLAGWLFCGFIGAGINV